MTITEAQERYEHTGRFQRAGTDSRIRLWTEVLAAIARGYTPADKLARAALGWDLETEEVGE